MQEIRTKKKHIAGKGLYGYPRQHNGRSTKKVKKLGDGIFQPYDKRAHALYLQSNMKLKMIHGDEAKRVLGDV